MLGQVCAEQGSRWGGGRGGPHLCLRVHLQHAQLRRDHGGQGGAVHVGIKDAHLRGRAREVRSALRWVRRAPGGVLPCRAEPLSPQPFVPSALYTSGHSFWAVSTPC